MSGPINPQAAVDQLFGAGRAEVVDSVSDTKISESEIVLINGTPVKLVGIDGEALKEALIAGKLPDHDLINRVLSSVLGTDLKGITKVESEVNTKSKFCAKDSLSVLRDGKVIDHRVSEWSQDSATAGRRCEQFHPNTSFSSHSSSLFTPSPNTSSRTSPSPSPTNKFTSYFSPEQNKSSDFSNNHLSGNKNSLYRSFNETDNNRTYEQNPKFHENQQNYNKSSNLSHHDSFKNNSKNPNLFNDNKYSKTNGVKNSHVSLRNDPNSSSLRNDPNSSYLKNDPNSSSLKNESNSSSFQPSGYVPCDNKITQVVTAKNLYNNASVPNFSGKNQYNSTSVPSVDGKSQYNNTSVPSFDGKSQYNNTPVPSFDGKSQYNNTSVPSFDGKSQYNNTSVPSFDGKSQYNNTSVPSFDGKSQYNNTSVPDYAVKSSSSVPANKFRFFSNKGIISNNLKSHAELPNNKVTASNNIEPIGPYLSPDLEQSLSRASIKDFNVFKKKKDKSLDKNKKGVTASENEFDVEYNSNEFLFNIDDDDGELLYQDGMLISGRLDDLILHATPTLNYYPDASFLFAFFLSSRLFVPPHKLLRKIYSNTFNQKLEKDRIHKLISNMVQLLGEWSETFPYDFRDEEMMAGVRELTHKCIALQPSLRRDVTQVLHNLLNKLTQLERYEEAMNKISPPAPSNILAATVCDISEVSSGALTIAENLTFIEMEKLSYIGPEEFVQSFLKDNLATVSKNLDQSRTKDDNLDQKSSFSNTKLLDQKRTTNLESYIQWFNRLSYFVASQTVLPSKKKQRASMIELWIEIARECFNLGNFNSLAAIMAGLNMTQISRLKKTWNKIPRSKMSALEHQMDPSSNFSSYRSTLKAAIWRLSQTVDPVKPNPSKSGRSTPGDSTLEASSAGVIAAPSEKKHHIVIPFFSLLVKDFYFINAACVNRLPNGHINFEKFWQLAKQVNEFLRWKNSNCPFEKDQNLYSYLQSTPVLSEKGLTMASFEAEAPENNYEKEQFKALKAEMSNKE